MKKTNYIAFAPMTKKERFKNAVNLIENFLRDYNPPYKFKLEEKTTNNYNKFKIETARNGYISISNEGNEKTIYSDPKYNIISRFWHDITHLKHDLNFSFNDESIVCFKQIEDLEIYSNNNAFNVCTLQDAKEILYHDIIGQSAYYYTNKKFVDDQYKFVFSRFLNKGSINLSLNKSKG